MNDQERVFPHILCRDGDTEREQVAVATVDDVEALIVPISEDLARGVIGALGYEGMEAHAVTLEEIEELCAGYGLATVGLFGLDDGGGLDVLYVETVGLVLEESREEGA